MLDSTSPLLGVSQRLPPSNLQAEQALLGAILANNKAHEMVAEFLDAKHFSDPVNGRIYEATCRLIESGRLVDTVTLKTVFENSGILDEVGGTAYLARLTAAMVGIINAVDYAKVVRDTWIRRQLIDIGTNVVNQAFSSDQPSVAQIDSAEEALFGLTDSGSENDPVPVGVAAKAAIEEGKLVHQGMGIAFNSTGFQSLDRAILGLRGGHLIVAGGRPGMGKSALARNIAINVATRGDAVAYFLLEEQNVDFGASSLAQLAGVQVAQILNGECERDKSLSDRIVPASAKLSGLPLFLFEKPRQSLRSIGRAGRRLKRQNPNLRLIVVDYLQLMADPPGVKEKRLAVGANAYGLKDLAKELDVTVLLLSQLSRKVEERTDKRPTMADLRETGEIEDAADAVSLLYREEYYYRQTSPKSEGSEYRMPDANSASQAAWEEGLKAIEGKAEILIPKVRRSQPTIVTMRFNGAHLRFEEYEE